MERKGHGNSAVRQGEIAQTLVAIADAYVTTYRAKGATRRLALTSAEVAGKGGDARLAGAANALRRRAARFLASPMAKAPH